MALHNLSYVQRPRRGDLAIRVHATNLARIAFSAGVAVHAKYEPPPARLLQSGHRLESGCIS